MGLLFLALTASFCGGETKEVTLKTDPCSGELAPEMARLCASDEAREKAQTGDARGAMAVCNQLERGLWKDECHFLVAEEVVPHSIQQSVAACAQAGRFHGQCVAHVVWYRKSWPIEVTSANAQAQVHPDRY